jgi:hypothetical protein
MRWRGPAPSALPGVGPREGRSLPHSSGGEPVAASETVTVAAYGHGRGDGDSTVDGDGGSYPQNSSRSTQQS